MAFTLPDKGEGQNDIQSILFQEYLDVIAASETDFVVSACAVSAQGSPNMVVSVATGVVFSNGARFAVTGANVTHTTADVTNPRLDLVVINNAGTIAIRTGTAAAAPKPAARSANDVALAVVFIPANDTTISTDQIVDLRMLIPNIVGEKMRLPNITNPAAPNTDEMYFYARKLGGRMLPKWLGPSGVDTVVQPALFGSNQIFWTPATGTTVTNGFGTTWTKGASAGTVSTPTPSTTSPTVLNAMKRTRHANAVTTTNQAMGIINTTAGSPQFWRGNASGLGGFFFFARFGLGIWLAGSRIFCGMTAGTAEVVTSDTIANHSIGLSRLLADTSNTLNFVARDGTTTNTMTVTGATIATGAVFDVYIFARPNDSTIYFRVDQLDNGSGTNLGTLLDSSTGTNLPTNITFLGPQVEMSNGTANITANTVAIDVNRIYVESDK